MNRLWDRAVLEAGIESQEKALDAMRNLTAEEVMTIPALQVSRLADHAHRSV
jgi:hypothetical protein